MKFKIDHNILTVTKESTDTKRYTNGGWGNAESTILYDIKNALIALGVKDLIKKRMWRDGHMVDDNQQYITTRSGSVKGPHIYIYDELYAVRNIAEDWKRDGKLNLHISYDVYEKQGENESRHMLEEIIGKE